MSWNQTRKWQIETVDLGLLPEQEMRDRARNSSEYERARRGAEAVPVQRILRAAALSGQGPDAVTEMLRLFRDDDSAVRFWAVIGLTNAAAQEEPAVNALRKALKDPAVEVRIVAAEALCRANPEHSRSIFIDG